MNTLSVFKPIITLVCLVAVFSCKAETAPKSDYTVITRAQLDSFSGKAIYATDTVVYIGEMKEGKRHGYGVSYGKNSSVIAGNWQNDKLQGEAVTVSFDINSVTVGHYQQDSMMGEGAVTLDGEVVKGAFIKDSPIPQHPECFNAGQPIPCTESNLLK